MLQFWCKNTNLSPFPHKIGDRYIDKDTEKKKECEEKGKENGAGKGEKFDVLKAGI